MTILEKENYCINQIIYLLKRRTKNRTETSIKNFKYFLKIFCKYFETDIISLYENKIEIESFKDEDIKFFIEGKSFSFLFYLEFLCKNFLNILFNAKETLKLYKEKKKLEDEDFLKNEIKIDYGTPYISNEDLELIYNSITDEDKIIFLLFITTGMRRGAFLNIKKENIDLETNILKTIEKGNVETYYLINPELKFLLQNNHFNIFDKVNTPAKLMTRMYKFGKIIQKEVYPHLFRFTFSKIVLNNTQNVENIQTLLNHSNLMTTKLSYIKETRLEKMKRMNLPWFNNPKSNLPFFLTTEHITTFL